MRARAGKHVRGCQDPPKHLRRSRRARRNRLPVDGEHRARRCPVRARRGRRGRAARDRGGGDEHGRRPRQFRRGTLVAREDPRRPRRVRRRRAACPRGCRARRAVGLSGDAGRAGGGARIRPPRGWARRRGAAPPRAGDRRASGTRRRRPGAARAGAAGGAVIRCAACGAESPESFRFCPSCGASLEAPAPARELRKVVTVVFCDLSGSTALGDRSDPEALRSTMRAYYEQMRAILERHGGTVEKFVGDAVMAVFGVPISHEDDALRAVRAAWEMRSAVPALGLQARIGVNTGEVVAGDGDTLVTGDAVNVAARLEQGADPGEVLIGEDTRRLVRDAVTIEPVELAAKGKPEPVRAYRLLELDPEASGFARRLDAPLIGRRSELDQLRDAFGRAVRERRCHLFTLLGPAGVGKSRLVAEFVAGLDATVLHGRCLDYGEGITFWPVISVLKELGDRATPTLTRLVEGASTPNELFWTVRTQLEEVAAERPLVVCFDDIHWGEQTFLDLIDHVADLSRGAPLLVLCLARPELLDRRPGWGGGKLNATTILLEPLTADECVELIAAHGGVEPATRERILAAADGNPLFVEEMVALVHEDGDVRVPSTVHALLQARLDQLAPAERTVMERGSVEGQVFHRSAVVELTRAPDVELQLATLVRKELIHPAPATLGDDHAFRFRHLLIRDAAYDALPKETRAELHERFADWLECHGRELIELDEVVGYHLEQAARYRRELGRPGPELERRAGRHLAAAGSRAAARSDAHGGRNLLGRAIELLPRDDEQRPRALIDQITLLSDSPEIEERTRLIAQLEKDDDPLLRLHGRIARLVLRLETDPRDVITEAERVAAEAAAVFAENDDDLGAAHAQTLVMWTNWMRSQALPADAAAGRVIEHARRANLLALASVAESMTIGTLKHGPFSPEEVRVRLAERVTEGTALAAVAGAATEAYLAAREGRFDDALALQDESNRTAEELGLYVGRAAGEWQRAGILREAGRLDEAIEAYRDADARTQKLGQTAYRSTLLIDFAQALYRSGETDEADRVALEGEELGAAEDIVNFAYGRSLRAQIEVDRGAHEKAERLGREALEYAYQTDFPEVHARAHEGLAHALAAVGRRDEARQELNRALERWQHNGYAVDVERVRGLLVEL
ncbi:MAG: hypothetical protein C5B48_12600 [Candidatus Rokuibacteriota bacterium]|nr:MAG: hypothetical protein C5B48_12600 [Candidatus Rokubacteria bacterium]